MSTRIRIQPATMAQLRYLTAQSSASIEEVLAKAIDERCRRVFLEDCNEAYARLKSNKAAWKRELRERKAWDSTVGDGLADS